MKQRGPSVPRVRLGTPRGSSKVEQQRESIQMQLLKLFLMIAFSPAFLFFECLKKVAVLWLRPVDWALRKVFPDYINDFSTKKEQITHKFKQKADESILSMSSIIAK
jgi:hypothetical protein